MKDFLGMEIQEFPKQEPLFSPCLRCSEAAATAYVHDAKEKQKRVGWKWLAWVLDAWFIVGFTAWLSSQLIESYSELIGYVWLQMLHSVV